MELGRPFPERRVGMKAALILALSLLLGLQFDAPASFAQTPTSRSSACR